MAGYSFVAGTNNITGNYTTVIGGYNSNTAIGHVSFSNFIPNPDVATRIVIMEKLQRYKYLTSSSGNYSSIVSGYNNIAFGHHSLIGFGSENLQSIRK